MLQSLGFGYVWINQGVGSESKFLSVFKQRIIDVTHQEWVAGIRDKERFRLYTSFKTTLGGERYFNDVRIKCFRDALVRFRLGVSNIQKHRNRFIRDITPGMNDCPFCPQTTEDELHVLFHCPKYSSLRPDCYKSVPQHLQQQRLSEALACRQASRTRQLAWFLFKAFEVREAVEVPSGTQ